MKRREFLRTAGIWIRSEEHTRAEFVRAYDADSSAVRIREDVKDAVEADADLNSVVETLRERGAL